MTSGRFLRRMRASKPHLIPDRPPLRLNAGDHVTAGQLDTEWPAFVFVTADRGSGWVPARFLSAAAGPAEVVVEYDTTELPVEAGETVEVLAEDLESGWLWCRSVTGREGWVPLSSLAPVDEG